MKTTIATKFKLFTCASLMMCSYAALADTDVDGSGLFLEPGVSYQMTDTNINYPAPFRNSSANTRGFGLVLRGGVHVYQSFFVAADARYAILHYNDNGNNYSTSASAWDIAPVVGMQMKDYGARLYVGYVLAGNLDPRSANGFDYRFEAPNGWRVGVGLKVKHLGVNLEWQALNYLNTSVENRGPIAAGVSTKSIRFQGEGMLVSITAPFEFN